MEKDAPTQLCLNRISDWMVFPNESGVSRPYRHVRDEIIVRVPLEKARCRQKLLIEFPAYRKLLHESPFLAWSASVVSSLVPRGKNKPLFKVNGSCFVGGGRRGSKKDSFPPWNGHAHSQEEYRDPLKYPSQVLWIWWETITFSCLD